MRFGGAILFKNVNLQFDKGNHYGLVGANGSGKSTLLKILQGELTPEAGDITIPSDLKMGILRQNQYLYEDKRILDVVLMGRPKLWDAMLQKDVLLEKQSFSEAECHELDNLERIIVQHNGYSAASEAAQLLEGLGIANTVHKEALHILSGGYKIRVLLAQVLFSNPDILFLDEPTNHLDIFSIKWLEGYLKNFPGTFILATHDLHILNHVCDHIADVDFETIKIYKGNYSAFEEAKLNFQEQVERQLSNQEKKKEDMQKFVDRFRYKASKARQAQSKAKIIEKLENDMEALNLQPSSRCFPKFQFKLAQRPGIKILEAKNISKSYGLKKVLHEVAFEIERGDKVAFVGPNGIGKSTLLEIITGGVPADQGSFEWGHGVLSAYFPQDHGREVYGEISLLDWIGQFDREASQENLRNILGQVLFSGDDAKKSVKSLSGGEAARLILAKMMLLKHNVLIFDEPTNHLDIEATEALLQSLENYPGTVLIVSHNRHFVSRIANRIMEITHDAITDFKGTFEEYLEKREIDFLSTEKIKSEPVREKDSSLNYSNQKKAQRQLEQLQKKAFAAEEKCHMVEKELTELDAVLAGDGFYQNATKDELNRILSQKTILEASLHISLDEWEKYHQELQNLKKDTVR